MAKPLLILGGGGHAKVVIDALLAGGANIEGIADPDPKLRGARILGVPVLGGDEAILAMPPDAILLVNGLGSVRQPVARQKLFERFAERGYRFQAVIHRAAIIGIEVDVGEGAQLMAGSVVQSGSRIGRNVIINTSVSIDHDCRIDDHVHVAPGATLSGHVSLGKCTHVGTGAVITQGVSIGEGCLIGAGAVVVKDVPDGAAVRGIPARMWQ